MVGRVGSSRQRCCRWLEGMIIEGRLWWEHGRLWYSYLALTLEYFVGSSVRDQELFLINTKSFSILDSLVLKSKSRGRSDFQSH